MRAFVGVLAVAIVVLAVEVTDRGEKQRCAIGKMEVDRLAGDAEFRRDFFHRQVSPTASADQAPSGAEDASSRQT